MDDGTLSLGEILRRRLDLLDGARPVMARDGEVPGWVAELEERTRKGEL